MLKVFAPLLAPLLAVVSMFGVGTHATRYEKTIDRVSASVVRITGEFADEGRYTCSGFAIRESRILTASHCVGMSVLSDGMPVTVLKHDQYYDLALLAVDHHRPVLTIREQPVKRFEKLTALGYAFGWTYLTVSNETAFLIDVPPYDEAAPGILAQPGFIGGMSGGPIVDHQGRLVGMVQQSNESVGYGVGTLLMRAFLLGT